jgi:hypothetical protein
MVVPKQDNLKEDPPIKNQNVCLLSFVSPEDQIKKRQLFLLNKFMYNYGNKNLLESSQRVVDYINQVSRKNFEKVMEEYNDPENTIKQLVYAELEKINKNSQLNSDDILTETLREYTLDDTIIDEAYTQFELEQGEALTNEFNGQNENMTSTRGIKIRGIFDTPEKAEEHSKYLREHIEPHHNIYSASVGKWLPWNPNPDLIHSDYMLEELNELMGKYNKNAQEKEIQFENRKTELMNKPSEPNRDVLKQKLKDKLKNIKHN